MNAEIFRSPNDFQWYFRIKAKNGKIIAQSEGYKREGGAIKGIKSLYKSTDSTLVINTPSKTIYW